MRLHIGGWERREGWTILDAAPGPHVDIVGPCDDLGRFESGSVLEIYASHVLEHLSYVEALPRALKEWHRVLAPGGRAMISVPDFEVICQLFVDPSRADVWREEPYYSQLKAWARAYTPKGMIVLVKIGLRAIVLLPDEDVDLGTVNRSDDVFVDIIPGPGGNRYRVVHERPTGPAADKVEA